MMLVIVGLLKKRTLRRTYHSRAPLSVRVILLFQFNALNFMSERWGLQLIK
jgi:hypothetical protein